MDGWNASPWLGRTLLVLLTLLYGVQHSALAARRLKQAIARRWGTRGLQVHRLLFNAWAGVSFLPLLAVYARLPDRVLYALPWPWWTLAVAGQALGVYLVLDGLWRIGPASFLGLAPERPHLTCQGVYGWVRHPLYVGSLLFLWCTPVLTLNMLVFYAALSAYLFVGAWWEERKLQADLGPAYDAYRAAVPMWLPRPPRGALPCPDHAPRAVSTASKRKYRATRTPSTKAR